MGSSRAAFDQAIYQRRPIPSIVGLQADGGCRELGIVITKRKSIVISPNEFLLFLWFTQTQERGIRFALQACKTTKTQNGQIT
jgi:hypothetical protein